MAWPLVASGRAKGAVTLNTTGATFLIAAVLGDYLATVDGWDSRGNTWVLLPERVISGHRCTLAYCLSPTSVGAGHTITDPNDAVQDAEIHFYAFTAPGTPAFHSAAGADDGTFGGTSTKSDFYAGSMAVTPPSDDALVFAAVTVQPTSATSSAFGVNSGFTPGIAWPTTNPEYGGATAWLNQATAATVDPTISWSVSAGSSRWVSEIAVFTASGGGGGGGALSGDAVVDEPTAGGGAESAADLSGNATTDEPAAAGGAASAAELSGNATIDEPTAAGGMVGFAGTITSEPLTTNNGTLLANTPLNFVAIYDQATGALVVRKTGLSTNALGVYSFTDAAVATGTVYRHDYETVDGQRRMPLKAAS